MRKYCPNCDDYVEAQIITKNEEYKVRNEKINNKSNVLICNNCNEEIYDEKLDGTTLKLVYDKYRKRHGLLLSEEIRSIREKYDLSQRALGRLLNWGEITINRYENGAIQDSAHDEVLRLIINPANMKELFSKNEKYLDKSGADSLKKKINSMTFTFLSFKEMLSRSSEKDDSTGFVRFNAEKIFNMVSYTLSNKEKYPYKTKINKVLFLMDFLACKMYSSSISGCSYRHIKHGPVPKDYDKIYWAMKEEGLIKTEEKHFKIKGKDVVAEFLIPIRKADMSLFTDKEKRIVKFIDNKFKEYSADKLKAYAHKELPYKLTKNGDIISYKLASRLSLLLR